MTTIARREFIHSAVGLAWAALAGPSLLAEVETGSQTIPLADAPASLPKRDYRSKPFRMAVAFGDSITVGWTATSRELCWVNRLADSVNESQLVPMNMVNSGSGGDVVSPEAQATVSSESPVRWSATKNTWWSTVLTW